MGKSHSTAAVVVGIGPWQFARGIIIRGFSLAHPFDAAHQSQLASSPYFHFVVFEPRIASSIRWIRKEA